MRLTAIFQTVNNLASLLRVLAVVVILASWSNATVPAQQLSIREECPIGTLLGHVQIPETYRDRLHSLSIIKYPPELFRINGTAIYTRARVDRETLCRRHEPQCIVYISVVAEPDSITIPKIAVLIEDVNDNAPSFPSFPNQEYSIAVSESILPNSSHSMFELPLASDDDQRYGVFNYRLLDRFDEFGLRVQRRNDLQNVEIERVMLVLRKPLDREKKDSYQLRLIAYDSPDAVNAEKTATLTVRVIVVDANDHRPVFVEPLWRVSINEDFSLQTTFLTLVAQDLDAEHNGLIYYDLAPSASRTIREKFEIDHETGDLKLRDLVDFETQRVYLIPVVACDQAQPPLCGNATVEVTLVDVNDEAPSIAVAYENDAHSVNESAKPGTIVAFLIVTDRDSGSSGIGGVKCNSDNSRFALVQRAGVDAAIDNFTVEFNVVTTSVRIDRERLVQESHADELDFNMTLGNNAIVQEIVVVRCEDGGDRQRQSETATLLVTVLDANDNVPYFLIGGKRVSQVELNVPENAPSGTPVATLVALDDDAGENGRIVFSLTGGYQELFSIDRLTGELSTRREFDRELADSYSVNVTACDCGTPRLCSMLLVTVVIDDVNDCVPYLVSERDFVVQESADMNVPVGRLEASDRDATLSNQRIGFQEAFGQSAGDYEPTGFGAADVFSIDPDGWIRLRKPLKREVRDFYVFSVRLFDFGTPQRSILFNVTVRVLGTYDSEPRILFIANSAFPVVNSTVIVSFLEPVGTLICESRAIRTDLAETSTESEVIMTLREGNADNTFYIDAFSGVISLNRQLTTLDVGATRVLVIEANDGVRRNAAQLRVVIDAAPSRSAYTRSAKVSREETMEYNEPVLSTKLLLTVCICVMIIVFMIGLFTFVYVKYFYSTVDERAMRGRSKKKALATGGGNVPRRRSQPRRTTDQPSASKKQRATIESDVERQRLSVLSDGDIDQQFVVNERSLCRMSENPLNQLGCRSFDTDSGGDYAALDQLSDTRCRQFTTFLPSSHFSYGRSATMNPHAAAALSQEVPSSRSLASCRKQRTVECSECGVHIINEDAETVWRETKFGCASQLESQLSRTISNNQDASTINSCHDESASDNNVALAESCSDRLHLEDGTKKSCRPILSTHASTESRAFSVNSDCEATRSMLRNKRSTTLNQYDLCMHPGSADHNFAPNECANRLFSFCAHAPTADSYLPIAGASQSQMNVKRTESFLSTQLSTESNRKRVSCAVPMPADEHDRLLAEIGAVGIACDNRDQSRLEDLNANKLGRIPSTAIRLLPSRIEPETSYV